MLENIKSKSSFNIKDLADIVKKETQTIRSWENKKIIPKPSKKSANGWREYTKEDLADVLETILQYPWQRKIIKNENEIQYVIDCLRGKDDTDFTSLMGVQDND